MHTHDFTPLRGAGVNSDARICSIHTHHTTSILYSYLFISYHHACQTPSCVIRAITLASSADMLQQGEASTASVIQPAVMGGGGPEVTAVN